MIDNTQVAFDGDETNNIVIHSAVNNVITSSNTANNATIAAEVVPLVASQPSKSKSSKTLPLSQKEKDKGEGKKSVVIMAAPTPSQERRTRTSARQRARMAANGGNTKTIFRDSSDDEENNNMGNNINDNYNNNIINNEDLKLAAMARSCTITLGDDAEMDQSPRVLSQNNKKRKAVGDDAFAMGSVAMKEKENITSHFNLSESNPKDAEPVKEACYYLDTSADVTNSVHYRTMDEEGEEEDGNDVSRNLLNHTRLSVESVFEDGQMQESFIITTDGVMRM